MSYTNSLPTHYCETEKSPNEPISPDAAKVAWSAAAGPRTPRNFEQSNNPVGQNPKWFCQNRKIEEAEPLKGSALLVKNNTGWLDVRLQATGPTVLLKWLVC